MLLTYLQKLGSPRAPSPYTLSYRRNPRKKGGQRTFTNDASEHLYRTTPLTQSAAAVIYVHCLRQIYTMLSHTPLEYHHMYPLKKTSAQRKRDAPLLHHGGKLPDTLALLAQYILRAGGADDDFSAERRHAHLHTRVSLLCKLLGKKLGPTGRTRESEEILAVTTKLGHQLPCPDGVAMNQLAHLTSRWQRQGYGALTSLSSA